MWTMWTVGQGPRHLRPPLCATQYLSALSQRRLHTLCSTACTLYTLCALCVPYVYSAPSVHSAPAQLVEARRAGDAARIATLLGAAAGPSNSSGGGGGGGAKGLAQSKPMGTNMHMAGQRCNGI